MSDYDKLKQDFINRLSNVAIATNKIQEFINLDQNEQNYIFDLLMEEHNDNASFCLNKYFKVVHFNTSTGRILKDNNDALEHAINMKFITTETKYKNKIPFVSIPFQISKMFEYSQPFNTPVHPFNTFIHFSSDHVLVNSCLLTYTNIFNNLYNNINSLEFRLLTSKHIDNLFIGNVVRKIVNNRNYIKSKQNKLDNPLMQFISTTPIVEGIVLDFLLINSLDSHELQAYDRYGDLKFTLFVSPNHQHSHKASGNMFSSSQQPQIQSNYPQSPQTFYQIETISVAPKNIYYLQNRTVLNKNILPKEVIKDIFKTNIISSQMIELIHSHFNHKIVITTKQMINNTFFLIAYEFFLSNINTDEICEKVATSWWNSFNPTNLQAHNKQYKTSSIYKCVEKSINQISQMYNKNQNSTFEPIKYKPSNILNLGHFHFVDGKERLDSNVLFKGYDFANKYILHTIDNEDIYTVFLLNCEEFGCFQTNINKQPDEIISFFYYDEDGAIMQILFCDNEILINKYWYDTYKTQQKLQDRIKMNTTIEDVCIVYTGSKYSIFFLNCEHNNQELVVDTINHKWFTYEVKNFPLKDIDEYVNISYSHDIKNGLYHPQMYIAKGVCARAANSKIYFAHIDPITESFYDYLFKKYNNFN